MQEFIVPYVIKRFTKKIMRGVTERTNFVLTIVHIVEQKWMVTKMAERLTFEGNFCEIARCRENRWGKHCPDGACSQRKVWERLKQYEDSDAVSVVRCKDCVYWGNEETKVATEYQLFCVCDAMKMMRKAGNCMTNEDFFCAHGERRTDE